MDRWMDEWMDEWMDGWMTQGRDGFLLGVHHAGWSLLLWSGPPYFWILEKLHQWVSGEDGEMKEETKG